jgi:hypothetical protein
MAYYKMDLEFAEVGVIDEVLQNLSTTLNLPIETSDEWRSRRDAPFLQRIGTDIYIRHIRDLSRMEVDTLIEMATDLVGGLEWDYREPTTITINKPGSLTFKFFH